MGWNSWLQAGRAVGEVTSCVCGSEITLPQQPSLLPPEQPAMDWYIGHPFSPDHVRDHRLGLGLGLASRRFFAAKEFVQLMSESRTLDIERG